MTRLGFYIIHNNRYKLVKTVNVPWDFTIGGPDSDNPIIDKPIIGEWDPMKYVLKPDNIAYEDEFQIVVKEKIKLAPSEQKQIEKLYRITYNNIGIFEAVRQYMTPTEWQDFLNDENVNWLYKPDVYGESYISYFTELGYEQFKEKTFPLILNIFQEKNIDTDILEIVKEVAEENPPTEEGGGEDEGIEAYNDEIIEPEPQSFENWITNYFYNVLFEEKDFFNIFNTNRFYFILAEENSNVMGFMITYKGKTVVNFEEHDYRNIINAMHPNIRKEIITLDDSFGGYDDDSPFSQDEEKPDDSFGGFGEDEGFLISEKKGIDTYPNLF